MINTANLPLYTKSVTKMTNQDQLKLQVENHVAVLTLNRPEAKNALTLDMKKGLLEYLPKLENDPDIRCIVLTGAGNAFCAGGDTKNMAKDGKPVSYEDRVQQLHWEHRIPLLLHSIPKPTLAVLPGPAAGAGFALALACDLRIAADTAFVITAYANLGLAGDYGSSWFLPRLVGDAKAKELFFSPERLSAEKCLELGIVNRVTKKDDLLEQAMAWATQLAEGPPIAYRYMKDNINQSWNSSLEEHLSVEAERMVQSAQTNDYVEAVKAFSEKRKPKFTAS